MSDLRRRGGISGDNAAAKMAFAPGTVFQKREFMSLAEFQNGTDNRACSFEHLFESVTSLAHEFYIFLLPICCLVLPKLVSAPESTLSL